jgi:hypothetical protein
LYVSFLPPPYSYTYYIEKNVYVKIWEGSTSGEDGKGVSSIEMPCFLLIPGDNEGDFSC